MATATTIWRLPLFEGRTVTLGKSGVKFENTITTGHLLIAVPVVVAILGFLLPGMWIAQGYMRQTEDTAKTQVEMKAESIKVQADLKAEMKAGFAAAQSQLTEAKTQIQQQISNLPTQAARLEQVERRVLELGQTDRDTAAELNKLKELAIDTKARVDGWENRPVRATR